MPTPNIDATVEARLEKIVVDFFPVFGSRIIDSRNPRPRNTPTGGWRRR